MNSRVSLFGAISRAVVPRKKLQMVPSTGNGGWHSVIREPFAGAWQRNISLNPAMASSFHAVFASETLIARDVAKLGVKLMQRGDRDIWHEVIADDVYTPLLQNPNHFQTAPQFWETWILSKLRRGNTYSLKVRDNRRVVVALQVLNPDRVTPLVASDGSVFYQLATDELNGLPAQVTVPATEIAHDRFNCLTHPLCGVPPIYAAGLAAMQGLNIQTQSSRLFQNNAQPGGVLTAPGNINDDTAGRIKASFEASFTGENYGRVAVLGDALKFEKMSLTAEESQLIEQLKWSAEVVAGVYHIPAYKLGLGQRPAYNSAAQLDAEYFASCIQSLIEDAEACLDRALGIGKRAGLQTEFDIDNLIRMDTGAQAATTTSMVRGGIMSPNEGRARFNLPPLVGGDTIYLQQQDVPLSVAAAVTVHPNQASAAPAKAVSTGPAIGPAASGTTVKAEIEVGGKPGDATGDVARPRLPTVIVRVEGELTEALSDRVAKEIEAAPGPVHVHINSDGGLYLAAMQICAAIEEHEGAVTTVARKAHSGAALIAMCGDHRLIHADATMLVHEARSGRDGSASESTSADFARAISGYSGWSTHITRAWMRQESIFTADEAKRAGLVDAIIDPEQPTPWLDDAPKRRPSEWLRPFRETEAKLLQWKSEGSSP
jgi:HK97 family phage portal protein